MAVRCGYKLQGLFCWKRCRSGGGQVERILLSQAGVSLALQCKCLLPKLRGASLRDQHQRQPQHAPSKDALAGTSSPASPCRSFGRVSPRSPRHLSRVPPPPPPFTLTDADAPRNCGPGGSLFVLLDSTSSPGRKKSARPRTAPNVQSPQTIAADGLGNKYVHTAVEALGAKLRQEFLRLEEKMKYTKKYSSMLAIFMLLLGLVNSFLEKYLL